MTCLDHAATYCALTDIVFLVSKQGDIVVLARAVFKNINLASLLQYLTLLIKLFDVMKVLGVTPFTGMIIMRVMTILSTSDYACDRHTKYGAIWV